MAYEYIVELQDFKDMHLEDNCSSIATYIVTELNLFVAIENLWRSTIPVFF